MKEGTKETKYQFTVLTKQRKFCLQADNQNEYTKWINAFNRVFQLKRLKASKSTSKFLSRDISPEASTFAERIVDLREANSQNIT